MKDKNRSTRRIRQAPYLLNFNKTEDFMTEIKDAFEELFEAFDQLAVFALVFESVMLLAGSIWLTLALRALG